MVGTRRLNELVAGATPKLRLPETPAVVALSGGADSAALAHLVLQLGVDLQALHVNHSLPASSRMEEAARKVASYLQLHLEVTTVEPESGPSPEGKARAARYVAFQSVDLPVLTAHTRDDVAETVLINLTRGTGTAGLGGIPYHRPPNVYRPALDLTRSETREIATLARLPFVDDPMNEDLGVTRNRIRKRVLPELVSLNPAAVAAIARAATAVRGDNELLDALTPPPRPHLVVAEIATVAPATGDRMIMRWLEHAGIVWRADVVARVRALVDTDSGRQDLGGGRVAVRRGALIVIE